jgi:hypothetical protein
MDLLVFATGVAGSRMRELVLNVGRDLVVTLFGPQTFALVSQAGLAGISLLLGVFLGAAVVATFGLRAIAVASSRRRS